MSAIQRLLNRLLVRSGKSDGSRPGPETALAIVGDIHGRADLLNTLLAKLSKVSPLARLVFVGDYVDRGPDSRAVLTTLRGLPGAVCIRGNHETMLLEFLDNPIERGGRWLRNGGVETLHSYGIRLAENSSGDDVLAARTSLHEALSDGTESWLRDLPLHWRSGNLIVTHAGPDPARAVDGQEDDVFLWGHSRFLREKRSDGLWVAHGHWAQNRPVAADGRINVDTGAWRTGRLTAALVSTDGQVRFVHVR